MGNYAESLLASGERVLRRAHQHWFVFVANARWAVFALIASALLTVGSVWFGIDGVLWQLLGVFTLVLFVFGVLSFLWSIIRYRNEEYLITNRRLIHVEGVINKTTTDSALEKINDAVLSESLFGRMFGFGDLDVLTASEQGIERLRMLRDAKDFKKAMIEAKHELEIEVSRPTMPPIRVEQAPAPAPSPYQSRPRSLPRPRTGSTPRRRSRTRSAGSASSATRAWSRPRSSRPRRRSCSAASSAARVAPGAPGTIRGTSPDPHLRSSCSSPIPSCRSCWSRSSCSWRTRSTSSPTRGRPTCRATRPRSCSAASRSTRSSTSTRSAGRSPRCRCCSARSCSAGRSPPRSTRRTSATGGTAT